MNLDKLNKELISAARSARPADEVPYLFEKRVLGRLPAASFEMLDPREWWARGLWRAAIACLAFSVLAGALFLAAPRPAPPASDLSQDFENTMLASMNQDMDSSLSR